MPLNNITLPEETIILALEKELGVKLNRKQIIFFKDKDNKQRVKILMNNGSE